MIAAVWAALMLTLVVTLAACTWMLVRKFIVLLEAFAALLMKPAILDGVHRAATAERPVPAVLEPRSVVRARYHSVARERQERKTLRRLARRERAVALISSEPTGLN